MQTYGKGKSILIERGLLAGRRWLCAAFAKHYTPSCHLLRHRIPVRYKLEEPRARGFLRARSGTFQSRGCIYAPPSRLDPKLWMQGPGYASPSSTHQNFDEYGMRFYRICKRNLELWGFRWKERSFTEGHCQFITLQMALRCFVAPQDIFRWHEGLGDPGERDPAG